MNAARRIVDSVKELSTFKEKMWTVLIVTLVGGFFSVIQVLGLAWIDDRNSQRTEKVNTAVEEIHKATNGMKTELVNEVRKAAFAEGKKDEKEK